jgi:hypothetical protein
VSFIPPWRDWISTISNAEFKGVYDLAGRARAAIRGFIKYLIGYEQSKRKKGNLEQ